MKNFNENEWDDFWKSFEEKALVPSEYRTEQKETQSKSKPITALILCGSILFVAFVVIALIFAFANSTPKAMQNIEVPSDEDIEEWRGAFSERDIYEDCYASTVTVRLGRDAGGAYWSGFVVDGNGWIATSLDVMDSSRRGRLYVSFCDGREFSVDSIQRDAQNSIALLKISAKELKTVAFRDEPMQSGEDIIAMGALEYGTACVMSGEVSGALDDMLKINVGLDIHGTGAPVFDSEGYLVGIATSKSFEENNRITYALSAQKCKSILLGMKNEKNQ